MRLQSRGLGRKELVMDFREYEVVREGREVVIRGAIREPVRWDFSIRVCEDDLAGLFKVARRRTMLGFLGRALFRRKKAHHWSGDRDEHVQEAREAGKAFAEKIRAQTKERKTKEAAAAKLVQEAEEAARASARSSGPDADEGDDGTDNGTDVADPNDLEAAEA